MIYIHKDVIYDFKIYNYIKNILDKKRVPSKLIDAHDFDLVNSLDVKNDDVLIAMFKHDKEDLAMTKKYFQYSVKNLKQCIHHLNHITTMKINGNSMSLW